MGFHSNNPLLSTNSGQLMGVEVQPIEAPVYQGQVYPEPSCARCIPQHSYANFGTTDLQALFDTGQQAISQPTPSIYQQLPPQPPDHPPPAPPTATVAPPIQAMGPTAPPPPKEDLQTRIAKFLARPAPPLFFLPPQEPLPKEALTHHDFQEMLPILVEYVSRNYNCFYDAQGLQHSAVPSTHCASAWGKLHASDPVGFGIPSKNHNAILELIRPYISKPAVQVELIPTPTPPMVAPLPTPTPTTKIPTWLIVGIVGVAGVGLYLILR